MNLKGGYEVARQRFQCEQMAQTVLVGKDLAFGKLTFGKE